MSAHGVPVVSPLRGQLPGGTGGGEADFGGSQLARARAARASRHDPDPLPGDGPLLHPLAARAVATLALGTFGLLHWMQMVEPTATTRAWNGVGVMILVMAGLVLAGLLPRVVRQVAALLVFVGALAVALIAGGLADEEVLPGQWSAVSSAIGRGIDGLPGTRVPYRGLDPDLRLIIPLGGTALAALGAALAFWPRGKGRTGFRFPALLALVTLYAVPAVALILTQEFLRGALMAVLVVAFLRLDRLRRRDAPPAIALAVATAVLALALAPALDKDDPWWDYEAWSQSAAGARSATFTWDHSYGPLDWPRDGRELLRIKSSNRAYWKADNLDVFDGRRWVRDGAFANNGLGDQLTDGVDVRRLQRWSFDIEVSVRNLRSSTLLVAGSALGVDWPRQTSFEVRPGIYQAASRSLHRGDAYTAHVYVPQPSARDLRTSGSSYSGYELERFTGLLAYLEPRPGEAPTSARTGTPKAVISSSFAGGPLIFSRTGSPTQSADALLRESTIARSYALSRQLLERSNTPYEYVTAVERYLGTNFSYSESPPKDSETLEGFLFDTKIGYCQQFSGAMALLLRLGGIPTRVATGFSPGSYDRKANQYVVRDVDAHSWVEAWFPGIGWVVFDPTPATAPPRSQATTGLPSAGLGDVRDAGTRTQDPRAVSVATDGDGPPWGAIAGGAVLLGLAVVAVRRRRRVRGRGGPITLELERALQIVGGGVAPHTTLTALEARFAGTPPAAGYVRALRAQRYAPSGPGPTATERRGLRRALGRGRGIGGRARALWALPPRPRLRRAVTRVTDLLRRRPGLH